MGIAYGDVALGVVLLVDDRLALDEAILCQSVDHTFTASSKTLVEACLRMATWGNVIVGATAAAPIRNQQDACGKND